MRQQDFDARVGSFFYKVLMSIGECHMPLLCQEYRRSFAHFPCEPTDLRMPFTRRELSL